MTVVTASRTTTLFHPSPLGKLAIVGAADGIQAIHFMDDHPSQIDLPPVVDATDAPAVLLACASQLDAYFRGELRIFDVPLAVSGTTFERRVWRELLKIPYGVTRSYADLARIVGDEKTVRAVGRANGKNQVSIIVPCHRVIGSDGSLTGYGGGLWRKAWLLNHEGHEGVQYPLFRE